MDFAALLTPFTPSLSQVKFAGASGWAQEQQTQAAVDTFPVLAGGLPSPSASKTAVFFEMS